MQRVIEAPERNLLTARQCADWLNIGLSQFRALVKSGDFPAPIQIGVRKCQRFLWTWVAGYVFLKSAQRRGGGETAEGAPSGRRRGE